ncbi:hypothetical protein QE383_002466 [Pseudoxanthomonas winnipegensis]|uniref:Uncharacterized protein n=1 Tax=Pseudoxanthomonas winnipegensis TaxID=2480810 RepID=A0AAW8GEV3_9GAMM|nr:hypothetical protein [Pseudoxanthomonas winnipegensis]MDQ1133369.1 hypothetical protein [Pseudoxanthomonas winnipegensis]
MGTATESLDIAVAEIVLGPAFAPSLWPQAKGRDGEGWLFAGTCQKSRSSNSRTKASWRPMALNSHMDRSARANRPHQNGLKLDASDPTTSTQPSTSTNSRILNGAEISIGESIIMPIDISTLATTRSMITNGM